MYQYFFHDYGSSEEVGNRCLASMAQHTGTGWLESCFFHARIDNLKMVHFLPKQFSHRASIIIWRRAWLNARLSDCDMAWYTTVCPRMKLSKFWHHIAQKATSIWQNLFVEPNVVVFLTCVPNIRKFIAHYMKYKRLKWHMYGIIFPTFAKCLSHACGFTWVSKLYWPRYVVIVWFGVSLNVTVVVVS